MTLALYSFLAAYAIVLLETIRKLVRDFRGSRIPDVADSPAFTMNRPEPSGEQDLAEALGLVIAAGDSFRACHECGSQATTSVLEEYEMDADGTLMARLRETCGECAGISVFRVSPGAWAAMESARVWEQQTLARVTLRTAWANQNAELEALDRDVDPGA